MVLAWISSGCSGRGAPLIGGINAPARSSLAELLLIKTGLVGISAAMGSRGVDLCGLPARDLKTGVGTDDERAVTGIVSWTPSRLAAAGLRFAGSCAIAFSRPCISYSFFDSAALSDVPCVKALAAVGVRLREVDASDSSPTFSS